MSTRGQEGKGPLFRQEGLSRRHLVAGGQQLEEQVKKGQGSVAVVWSQVFLSDMVLTKDLRSYPNSSRR